MKALRQMRQRLRDAALRWLSGGREMYTKRWTRFDGIAKRRSKANRDASFYLCKTVEEPIFPKVATAAAIWLHSCPSTGIPCRFRSLFRLPEVSNSLNVLGHLCPVGAVPTPLTQPDFAASLLK